jgi:hypothetical protein
MRREQSPRLIAKIIQDESVAAGLSELKSEEEKKKEGARGRQPWKAEKVAVTLGTSGRSESRFPSLVLLARGYPYFYFP